jgi:1-deoxy-D-xylulose-5-phosphate synthase
LGNLKEQPSVLACVNSPRDLRLLDDSELARLADEIRELIITTTSTVGGHLASSLGAVELAIAIHRALDSPRDRIIWDVGHQAYAHKIITGRRDEFRTLRQLGGISGFPRRDESPHDTVDSGHSGTAISYGLGLALARDLLNEDYAICAVIGDGSMTSGIAYESMNQAGHQLSSNLIIILNDNEMSISQNVGGLAAYLSRLRIKPGYTHLKEELEDVLKTMPGLGDGIIKVASQVKETITHALVPGMLFESLGLKYVGPIDGHDVAEVEETIREARAIEGPVLIHAVTVKGKGFLPAERRPDEFHGVSSFDLQTGRITKKAGSRSYTDVFSDVMVELGREKPRLVAVTAAMKLGTGLDAFSRRFPSRFFDVGIAEQLGVNLSAGLALGGLQPVVAIYSTFLQRAFDQLSQEVCLHDLPVVFAVDRAGLVGQDGTTHHGYFDVSYLRMLPNMIVMAPATGAELESMLRFALETGSPTAVRFPRGEAREIEGAGKTPLEMGKGEIVRQGSDMVIFALGDMVTLAIEVAGLLQEAGVSAAVVNARFAKPVDRTFVQSAATGKRLVMTLEDNIVSGGYGSAVEEELAEGMRGLRVMVKGLPDSYVQHGTIPQLLETVGLSAADLAADAREALERT